jgi:hypothetical protein
MVLLLHFPHMLEPMLAHVFMIWFFWTDGLKGGHWYVPLPTCCL